MQYKLLQKKIKIIKRVVMGCNGLPQGLEPREKMQRFAFSNVDVECL